jgi:hypothetical protein
MTDKLSPSVDVTVWWGSAVIANHRVAAGNAFTVGDSDRATFRLAHPAIPSKLHTLIEATSAGGARLHPHGEMTVRGDTIVDVGDVSRITIGPLVFVVQHRASAGVSRDKLRDVVDFFYSKVLAFALLLQFGVVAAIALTPHFPTAADEALGHATTYVTRARLNPPPDVPEAKATIRSQISRYFQKNAPAEDRKSTPKKQHSDRQDALDALAALGLNDSGGAISNVFGVGGAGAAASLHGLRGANFGEAGRGIASRFTGAGAGGAGIGIDGLSDGPDGDADVDLGTRRKEGAKIKAEIIDHDDGLSREEIQRVMVRMMSQMRYCYEKELNRDPNLEGKLQLQWVIQQNGDAAHAHVGNGLGAAVADCVGRIVQRLKFPNPRGAGVVHVSYPLVFTHAGD